MKHIVKTTHYWIFKPTHPTSTIHFVRTQTENLSPVWFMGYENHMGLVSGVGGPLKQETIDELEKEFQKELEAIAN